MKKILFVFAILLFMGGCNSDAGDGLEEQTSETEVKKTEEKEREEVEQPIQDEETEIEEDQREEPRYKIDPATWSVVPISDANEKVVLLTIDDAPDKHGLQMAKTLKEHGVKAIFFVNGHFIDTDEEANVLKEIHLMGFPIGNHTYSHPNLSQISEDEQYKEIVALNDRIEEIIGERPKFFRAPFGVNTDLSRKIVSDEKMLLMNWSYGYDWESQYQSKDALTDIMINSPYLKNGANLLMHDRKWTSEALGDIVTGLKGKGFEMVDPAMIKTPE